ncbi:hypothetical protein PLESTB_001139200 [Pleodorina starrii]|uniref:Uncharacterized protein n=1 Tax=Pleodorina starrii TaxID=330485 RepID=A0A9W6BQU4_9CHLO|nr:hypothetical protein PLESTB_001139200 [Pleodorina starrii]
MYRFLFHAPDSSLHRSGPPLNAHQHARHPAAESAAERNANPSHPGIRATKVVTSPFTGNRHRPHNPRAPPLLPLPPPPPRRPIEIRSTPPRGRPPAPDSCLPACPAARPPACLLGCLGPLDHP